MLQTGGEFAAGGEVIVQIFQLDKRLELREQGQNFVDLLVVQENAEDCLTALPELLCLPQRLRCRGILFFLRLPDGALQKRDRFLAGRTHIKKRKQPHGQTQCKHETRDQNMLHASSSRMAAKYSLPSGSLVSRYTSCTRQL